jgi:hypothetical protein
MEREAPMEKFKQHILSALGFIILIIVISFATDRTVHAGPTVDAVVINPPTQPVPTAAQGTTVVAGTVNVGNSPTVLAQQSGPWSVNVGNSPTVLAQQSGPWSVTGAVSVANTPSVNIANSPTVTLSGSSTVTLAPGGSITVGNTVSSPLLVRDVDNPARNGMNAVARITIKAGSNYGLGTVYTVPEGKRLVIEHVSVAITIDMNIYPIVTLLEGEAFSGPTLNPNCAFQVTQGHSFDSYVCNELTRFYVDPGTNVTLFVAATSNVSVDDPAVATISGYLIDYP